MSNVFIFCQYQPLIFRLAPVLNELFYVVVKASILSCTPELSNECFRSGKLGAG